ncbi:spore coat protein CotS [Bacillus sp. FJAT-18017]|uniref:spore coat putative kinase YutH n=1 Tax=Bacillus sp. FJAT-18017 TaxID=1705566 RepID=UPI0006B01251|nr:spore coat protein YutH [Bacillus sp. FJAT-18017]ALC92690.1 spore coat protein CotS [Bacillus sp. FJAT-18017]
MLEKMLEQVYGIKSEEYMQVESFNAFRGNGNYYFVADPGPKDEEEIEELQKLAAHLAAYGDTKVPALLPTQSGTLLAQWENKRFCLLTCQLSERKANQRLGRRLAKFHERGRFVPFQVRKSSRIGNWKQLWEARMDQMEKVWSEKIFQPSDEQFEKIFIESFPYYLGLAENAVQYLVDTEIDDDPLDSDSGTVCHERFSEYTWGKRYIIKNPMDWVFDHRSRDLAEWARGRYFHNSRTCGPEITAFLANYQEVAPLSPFSWRLLVARLLFPVHYLETIETYYSASRESDRRASEERLTAIIRKSDDYEQFLAGFFALAHPSVASKLPRPEWLMAK